MLRFYLEVAHTAFRRQLIYRWANIAGLVTNIFFGIIFSYLIIALYRARPSVSGYNVQDTLRYTWLVQAMLMVVMPFSWQDLMLTIRSGEVVSDLSKPFYLYWYWFSRECGRSLYYFIFRAIPVYLAGMLLFGLGLPGEWRFWLAYSLALPLGAMLGIAYRFLSNVMAFWVIEARAVISLSEVTALFFAGSYVPLPLLPSWLRAITDWLPFRGFLSLPAEALLGKLNGIALWLGIGRQLLWLVVLTGIVLLLTDSATRRVVSQGG